MKTRIKDTQNLSLFPAEETLKAEKGNFWSGAAKADKTNTRKFTQVASYQVKDDKGNNVTFGTYVPNL